MCYFQKWYLPAAYLLLQLVIYYLMHFVYSFFKIMFHSLRKSVRARIHMVQHCPLACIRALSKIFYSLSIIIWRMLPFISVDRNLISGFIVYQLELIEIQTYYVSKVNRCKSKRNGSRLNGIFRNSILYFLLVSERNWFRKLISCPSVLWMS